MTKKDIKVFIKAASILITFLVLTILIVNYVKAGDGSITLRTVEVGLYLGIGDSNATVAQLSYGPLSGWRVYGIIALSEDADQDHHLNNDANNYNYMLGGLYRWNLRQHIFEIGPVFIPRETDLFNNRHLVVAARYSYRFGSKDTFCGAAHQSVFLVNDQGRNQPLGCNYIFRVNR